MSRSEPGVTRPGEAAELASYTDHIAQAIADPGAFLPRGDNYAESIPRWGTRAVLIVMEGFAAAVRAEERERIAQRIEDYRAERFAEYGNEENGPRNYDWALTAAARLAREEPTDAR